MAGAARAKRLVYEVAPLCRDYTKSLKRFNKAIISIARRWVLPSFKKHFVGDAKPKDKEAPATEGEIKEAAYKQNLAKVLKEAGVPRANPSMKTKTLENLAKRAGLDIDKLQMPRRLSDLGLADIKPGDYVKHRFMPGGNSMQVVSVGEGVIQVKINGGALRNYDPELLVKKYELIPYSFSDSFSDRIEKVGYNISEIAKEASHDIAKRQVQMLIKSIDKRFKNGLDIDFSKVGFTEEFKLRMQAIYRENVSLINSIAEESIKTLDVILSKAAGEGNQGFITRALRELQNANDKRIDTIARDQTAKGLQAVASARSQEAGFEYYQWITSMDERVSQGKGGHRQLHNKIFRYDTPEAVIDTKGTRGHPAQRVNCRCIAYPVYVKPGARITKADIGYRIE